MWLKMKDAPVVTFTHYIKANLFSVLRIHGQVFGFNVRRMIGTLSNIGYYISWACQEFRISAN